jgi:hypothetical protein
MKNKNKSISYGLLNELDAVNSLPIKAKTLYPKDASNHTTES